MHRLARRARPGIVSLAVALALSFAADTAAAAVKFLLFDMPSAQPYDVSHNGSLVTTIASSGAGAVALQLDAVPGDVVSLVENGDLQPPPPPVFTALDSPVPGCARAEWLPSGDPTVVGYTVSYGLRSVADGEAPGYEYEVDAGSASALDLCQLPAGTYYFAVRARSHAGLNSAYSPERTVYIIVVSVLISRFEAHAGDDGVALRWGVEADERVRGFRVYRSTPGEPEILLEDDLIAAGASTYLDRTARPGETYTYVLAAVKDDGGETRSVPVTVETPAIQLSLGQNAPNPFNPSTTIPFTLPDASRVRIDVFDVRGAHVAILVDGELGAGRHTATWDGTDRRGVPMASGSYFYTMRAGNMLRSKRMVLLK